MTRIEFRLSSHYFKELPPNKVVIIYKDQNLEHIFGNFIILDQILGTKELCYIVTFKVGERKRKRHFELFYTVYIYFRV